MAIYSNNPFALSYSDSRTARIPVQEPVNTSIFARVISVVLNADADDYKNRNQNLDLNGIRYRELTATAIGPEDEADFTSYPFAYPLDSNIKRVPLVGEIVEIVGKPKNLNGSIIGLESFYTFPINVFNKTQENIFPDQTNPEYSKNVQKKLEGLHSYPPLESFEGDIIIEGRSGQSLRMSGLGKDRGNYTDSIAYSSPITILRNGQPKIDPETVTFENINQDDSSIYLTSNHVVPLVQAKIVNGSYETPPTGTDTYRGKQILINSDRVVLNAKKENILISSTESTGLSGKTVNLDGEDSISVESKKIYLGKNSRNEIQYAVRGKDLEDYLTLVNNLLNTVSNILKAVPPSPLAISAALTNVSTILQTATKDVLPTKLASIKSKKIYVE